MSVLTSGRTEPCKNGIGGINEIWLTSFEPYSIRLMAGYKDMLLTSFPTTLVFEFAGQNKTFSEDFNEGAYDQEINIRLTKQTYEDVALLKTLIKKKVRAIVIDRMGQIKVAGLHNGLDIEISTSSGGSRFDFTGYELKMNGAEPFSAPFLSSFPGSGFAKTGVSFACLLASSSKLASLGNKVSSCNILQ